MARSQVKELQNERPHGGAKMQDDGRMSGQICLIMAAGREELQAKRKAQVFPGEGRG